MSQVADERLGRLADLWRRERRAASERFAAERRDVSLKARAERGIAVRQATVEEEDAAPGGRTLLILSEPAGDRLRIRPGDPVRLWWDEPEQRDAVLGTVSRPRGGRLAVMIDGGVPDRLEEGAFNLDLDAPQATFDRGDRAIAAFRRATGELGRLREVLFGEEPARFDNGISWTPLDPGLNEPQREAVSRALAAHHVALVHGPPGTGKTRTLVEVIRQLVARDRRVLATAASNTAVDNLAERLIEHGVGVVRLGHPARVAPAVESRTLDALLEASGDYDLVRGWNREANAIRRKVATATARGRLDRAERRQMLQEAGRLNRDARKYLQGLQRAIIDTNPVICATAAGADVALLSDADFDVVVLDEATQAPDPIALVALSRAERVIMAGDPCQLPPTVIDLDAMRQGLGTTAFDRLATSEASADLVRMLIVQHRMHETLMRFPSDSMYQGRLVAAAAVVAHRLEELPGVVPDPERPGPLVFIDSAGKGWEEHRTADDPSTSNPQQAERTAEEVRRILDRGLPPADLAVITPYDAQARLLLDLLPAARAAGLEIGTVDGFQGREKEAVVVDLVRSNPDSAIGFLADTRRMNVALTRARRFLLVIGDSATLGGHPYYDGFMAAAETAGAWISAWE